MDSKQLKEAVVNNLQQSTALEVSAEVVKLGQDIMQDELQASHLHTIGMMEIDNTIDDDRAVLEERLDELRALNNKHSNKLQELKKALDREIEKAQGRLKRTEVRRNYMAAVKALNRVNHLQEPFEAKDPDQEITIKVSLPKAEAEDEAEREGYFAWSFSVTTPDNTSRYASTGSKVHFCGTRSLSKKVLSAHAAVCAAEDKLAQLQRVNIETRKVLQDLEVERKTLQRKLRKQIVGKSAVGKEFRKLIQSGRGKRKLLPIPQDLK